ncbi:hypothetical protein SS05631_c18130 [Sinorhizobium sp. CCBAU 05631]|nr:hypothetical protein SAMCCGM7_Ch1918 [Sinorhizobium americanum CCGM7]ASY56745.1 hypothetical protein SS05631_c18130 [Sinorhizobium sp. CCBAU 05631]
MPEHCLAYIHPNLMPPKCRALHLSRIIVASLTCLAVGAKIKPFSTDFARQARQH